MAEIRMPAGGNGEHREVANLSLIKGDREHSVAASTQEAGFDYAIVDANTASLTKAVAKRIRADLQPCFLAVHRHCGESIESRTSRLRSASRARNRRVSTAGTLSCNCAAISLVE